jgi:hypothetical protein
MADRFGIKTHAVKAANALVSAASMLSEMAEEMLSLCSDRFNLAVSLLGPFMHERADNLRALTKADFDLLRARFRAILPDSIADSASGKQRLPEVMEDAAAEAQAVARTSGFWPGKAQFNVNYSMRPHASGRIDGARLVGELAEALGDTGRGKEKIKEIDAILQQPSTWRPLMLIVRERGKESSVLGLNFGLRIQLTNTVEGQRTAAQFPFDTRMPAWILKQIA